MGVIESVVPSTANFKKQTVINRINQHLNNGLGHILTNSGVSWVQVSTKRWCLRFKKNVSERSWKSYQVPMSAISHLTKKCSFHACAVSLWTWLWFSLKQLVSPTITNETQLLSLRMWLSSVRIRGTLCRALSPGQTVGWIGHFGLNHPILGLHFLLSQQKDIKTYKNNSRGNVQKEVKKEWFPYENYSTNGVFFPHLPVVFHPCLFSMIHADGCVNNMDEHLVMSLTYQHWIQTTTLNTQKKQLLYK